MHWGRYTCKDDSLYFNYVSYPGFVIPFVWKTFLVAEEKIRVTSDSTFILNSRVYKFRELSISEAEINFPANEIFKRRKWIPITFR
jgi:hypothetical protein